MLIEENSKAAKMYPFVGRSMIRCLQTSVDVDSSLFPNSGINVAMIQSNIELIFSIMDELGIRRIRSIDFSGILEDLDSESDETTLISIIKEEIEWYMKEYPEDFEMDEPEKEIQCDFSCRDAITFDQSGYIRTSTLLHTEIGPISCRFRDEL